MFNVQWCIFHAYSVAYISCIFSGIFHAYSVAYFMNIQWHIFYAYSVAYIACIFSGVYFMNIQWHTFHAYSEREQIQQYLKIVEKMRKGCDDGRNGLITCSLL